MLRAAPAIVPKHLEGGAVLELRPETDGDWWEVEALFDLCFAPGREALSSYRLRDGVPPVPGLSSVARDEGGILAGAIRYWPVRRGRGARAASGARSRCIRRIRARGWAPT